MIVLPCVLVDRRVTRALRALCAQLWCDHASTPRRASSASMLPFNRRERGPAAEAVAHDADARGIELLVAPGRREHLIEEKAHIRHATRDHRVPARGLVLL